MDWDDAKKAAMKILGPKGKIPEFSFQIKNHNEDTDDSWEKFKKDRKALKETFDKHKANFNLSVLLRKEYLIDLSRDNLGLNPKDKAESKKIAEARKLLSKNLEPTVKRFEAQFSKLDTLTSHITSIINYDEK